MHLHTLKDTSTSLNKVIVCSSELYKPSHVDVDLSVFFIVYQCVPDTWGKRCIDCFNGGSYLSWVILLKLRCCDLIDLQFTRNTSVTLTDAAVDSQPELKLTFPLLCADVEAWWILIILCPPVFDMCYYEKATLLLDLTYLRRILVSWSMS